jgi:hypothetical protein
MKYIVLDGFKAVTKQGEINIEPGQEITLADDKALTLLNEGKIASVEKVSYKVYSKILRSFLWVVYNAEDMKALRSQVPLKKASDRRRTSNQRTNYRETN